MSSKHYASIFILEIYLSHGPTLSSHQFLSFDFSHMTIFLQTGIGKTDQAVTSDFLLGRSYNPNVERGLLGDAD